MQSVLSLPAAVLLHLDPLTIVGLVFHGDVVAPLADVACQRDLHPLLVLCHCKVLFSGAARQAW